MEADVSSCRHQVVEEALKKNGFKLPSFPNTNCVLIWQTFTSSLDVAQIGRLKSWQRINRFPGMNQIAMKDSMTRNLTEMANKFPDEFDFFPKSWVLPQDREQVTAYHKMAENRSQQYYIVKPSDQSCGTGIWLTNNISDLAVRKSLFYSKTNNCVIQEYIDDPFLIDGFKSDIRIYALVTSCDPLRVYLYNDGIVRLATAQYQAPTVKNQGNIFMHLTNYSVNKSSSKFDEGDAEGYSGNKRSLAQLFNHLRQTHQCDVNALKNRIQDIVLKTIIAVEPHLFVNYRNVRPNDHISNGSVCFQLLGLDIILDSNFKPWLLEVNGSPSFGTETELDQMIKGNLLQDTFKLLNVSPMDRDMSVAIHSCVAKRRLAAPSAKFHRTKSSDPIFPATRVEKLEQLHRQLFRIRHESAKDHFDFENRGNFDRIFPPELRNMQWHYGEMIVEAFKTLQPVRSQRFMAEIETTYCQIPDEFELIQKIQLLNSSSSNTIDGGSASLANVRNSEIKLMYQYLEEKYKDNLEDQVEPGWKSILEKSNRSQTARVRSRSLKSAKIQFSN